MRRTGIFTVLAVIIAGFLSIPIVYAAGDPSALDPQKKIHFVTPFRALDTRAVGSKIPPQRPANIPLAGKGGLPQQGISSVVVNVTALNAPAAGGLAIYGGVHLQPSSLNLFFDPGAARATEVIIPTAADGGIYVWSTQAVDLLVDVKAYYTGDAYFKPVTPNQVYTSKSRSTGSDLVPKSTDIPIAIAGNGGVPNTGVEAVVFNVVAINPTAPGSLTLRESGSAPSEMPAVSFSSRSKAATVIAPFGDDGKVLLNAATSGSLRVDIDLIGYFTSDGDFVSGNRTTVYDSRLGDGALPSGHQTIKMPAPYPMSGVFAYTHVFPTSSGYITASSKLDTNGMPSTSDINFSPNQQISNTVLTSVDVSGGTLSLFLSSAANVAVVIAGYFQP